MVELLSNERIDHLIPQELEIIQSSDTFMFSIDALLLAYFTKINTRKTKRVVDFCTGNGVIPLLLSQKTQAPIFGIEIQDRIADMARRSVELNHLSKQVTIYTNNIKAVDTYFDKHTVDVITCNPPYFKVYEDSWMNPNDHKAIARHEITMTVSDIFANAFYLLRGKGKLFMVHRPERLSELIVTGSKYHMTLKRMQFIYPKPETPAKTVLLEFMKEGQEKGMIIDPPFYTQTEANTYSDEAKRIIYGE